ncbi:MAG: YegS/Rv2252/BmrU family lipid kinase [Ruminococcaceae bacterium]|nr:YegS/Rv2252/BmrU family lipid kinase [Oscillospiraceae bacterium]
MKQLLLVLNPTSGTKKAAKNLPEIISVFNRADYDVHVYITTCQGDGTAAVRRFARNMDLLVCCGGDGTLNEIVTGLIEEDLYVPVGYIPSGSTNDFANSLHLSANVVDAAEQIVRGTAYPYDVGRFGTRFFTYVASFGAFTRASYQTPQSIKNALGHTAYLLEGIQELSSIRKEHIRIELDGEILEDDYLFGAICNSTSIGGILTLPPRVVDMSDGKFELVLLRTPRDLQELHDCVLALRNQTYDCGMLTFRKADVVRVWADPEMTWSLDGERAEGSALTTIENIHRRITLLH